MFDACVYWIHHPTMSDYYTEGYVGVTTEFDRRSTVHMSNLRNNKHENIHLQRAYNINSDVVISVIFVGYEQDCYALEEELRPHRNKAWNINTGGTKPPAYVEGRNQKGGRGPVKPVTSPNGVEFESRKQAAQYYGVTEDTIRNWMKDPTKPWKKRASVKQHLKHDLSDVWGQNKRAISTPKGTFESVKAAAVAYNVTHGSVNYWLKTGREGFSYITP